MFFSSRLGILTINYRERIKESVDEAYSTMLMLRCSQCKQRHSYAKGYFVLSFRMQKKSSIYLDKSSASVIQRGTLPNHNMLSCPNIQGLQIFYGFRFFRQGNLRHVQDVALSIQ